MSASDVVITGIGLVSSLGEGVDEHWRAFSAGQPPKLDAERFSPYPVHPLPEIDWTGQIPKRGDQRQMEQWQRLGAYTAGLALDDAGLKGDEALTSSMDMIVAAGGGERDAEVDAAILEASRDSSRREVLLNEKLVNDLRPTLFLAQLSNLLAGNISIVHKVTGSSRTFMGEEGAGVAAVSTAAARIRDGLSSHALVGGAFNAEHPDVLLSYKLGGYLHEDEWMPLWRRETAPGGGVILGSGSAFLVLESRAHAEARKARFYARVGPVAGSRTARAGDRLTEGAARLASEVDPSGSAGLVISGASGAKSATAAEKSALGHLALRGFAALTGHLKEAQFPFAVALAALAASRGEAPAALDVSEEHPFDGRLDAVLATAVGYNLHEGAALVLKA